MLVSAVARASVMLQGRHCFSCVRQCCTRIDYEPASSQARLLSSDGCMSVTCMTTMLPTAAAACAALGEGGSPCGFIRSHFPLLTSMMCTSLVAPASRIPEQSHRADTTEQLKSGCSWVSAARMCVQQRGQGIIWGFAEGCKPSQRRVAGNQTRARGWPRRCWRTVHTLRSFQGRCST